MEQRLGNKEQKSETWNRGHKTRNREVRHGTEDGRQRAGKQGTGDEKEISFILSFWSFSLHRKLFFSDRFDR
jgi:hypothetical protein